MKVVSVIAVGLIVSFYLAAAGAGVVAPGAKVEKLASVFAFTEGPAADPKGNVYFTDQPNDKIYIWSTEGKLSVFLAGCERSNGMYFDADGSLLACADLHNRLVSFDRDGKMTVLVENYNGKKLNGPNDLWRDPKGGIYFTDPYYRRPYWTNLTQEQDCECVYYLAPDRKTLTRVANDLVKPNGIRGTADGKLLYIADIGDNKTYVYTINPDGTLSNKKLFCKLGSDGMTIDDEGNVYLTGKGVTVFNSAGEKIDHIDINEPWTANLCFGGKDQDTLFITASKSLYAVKMRTKGITWPASAKRSEDRPAAEEKSVVAPGAKIEKLAGNFKFTEGPIADAEGNVYFVDVSDNRIHKWSVDGKLTTFHEDSGGACGLDIDDKGNLYVCEGRNRRITRITPDGSVTVLCDNYKGKKLNSPNDLWRDKKGGIYFSDPIWAYKKEDMELPGQYVFYLPADSHEPILVIDDMSSPNGVVGTKDGKLLYVADYSGRKTWVYQIKDDGTLSDKKLFVPIGADGMELDEQGNLYLTDLTGKGVNIISPEGKKIGYISVPNSTSNLCFGGKDGKTLFITARDSFYSIQMNVKGQ
ncbi:MAG: SMP-30/gluconolactonase/LRE family protein [Sedimentisphaerales bacterium]|jgi:gluconolactonase